MNIEAIQVICKKLPAVTEDIKWGNDLVFSVGEKMFCVVGLSWKKRVEVYSVDEAFVDLSMINPENIAEFALHIRKTVERWTGISVSVGVAPTKTLAKIANHIAKKNKTATKCVTTLMIDDDIRNVLKRTR